jgi:hypothetical protein
VRLPSKIVLPFLALSVFLAMAGCRPRADSKVELNVPRGYMARLEIKLNGRLYGFGPFVGYYFRPEDPDDLSRLGFVCFNERGFYTKEKPVNDLLFKGQARLVRLPENGVRIPSDEMRIHPVFFSEAPPQWLESRPEPRDEFVHFHSCYDARGHAPIGYWLRHVAEKDFLYDMGGRVGPGSPLYHRVRKGVDRDFARIIEFDDGPPVP